MRPFINAPLRWFNHHPLWSGRTTRVWGRSLRAPTFDRWLALRLHQLGLMGTADKRFLTAQVRPGMTVVDIGANQGLYSLLFARLAGGGGKVIAFEPDDMLYRALAANVASNEGGNVRTRNTALGSRAGTMTLHRSLFNSGDNRLSPQAEQAGPREGVEIRVERLDQALAGERVDFIKMDVQGWEMEVLRGMQGLLDEPSQTPLAIYFEFWPQGLRDAGSDPLELLHFLTEHRFSIHQPRGGEPGQPVRDFATLVRSMKPGAYTNLYASHARRENR